MAILTKIQLEALNQSSFPDNTSGAITPTILRNYNTQTIDTLVNSLDTGSFATGSLLLTASFDNGSRNLTFTKGNSSTFVVNIPDASGSVLPSGVVSGSSQINYPQISNIPSGIVSGAAQVTPLLPTGTVSGSSQIVLQDTTYTDGVSDQFLSTDGAGNLSFDWVKTLHQNIRNVDSVTIPRGTPLFVSGSTGDNANVFVADSSNPLRRPATLIAFDSSLAPAATGTAIISGEIQNVNTTGFPAGTVIYLAPGGGYTATRPTGSASVQVLGVVTLEATNGRGIVFNQVADSLPNIQQGYAWVGDVNSVPQPIPTSSFGGGGTGNGFPFSGSAVITGSLSVSETIKSQVYINPQTIDGFTIPTGNNAMLVGPVAVSGSIVVEGTSNLIVLSQVTSSTATLPSGVVSGSSQLTASYDLRYALSGSGGGTIPTGSFATTGSNTFIGNQTITGSLFLSSSDAIKIIVPNFPGQPAPGGVSITGSLAVNGNFAVGGGGFTVGQANIGKIVGSGGDITGLAIVSDALIYNDSGVGAGKNLGVSGSIFVSQSISVGEAVRLKQSNPLPSGTTGSLAVSGSNLYFFDGTWRQVSLI